MRHVLGRRRSIAAGLADHHRDLPQPELGGRRDPEKARDELVLPPALGDLTLGRAHDDRHEHPLQPDAARERTYVL